MKRTPSWLPAPALLDARWRPRLWAVALVAGTVGAAMGARWLLDPWLGDRVPFVTLYAAVALAVWLGGAVPAAATALLGYLASDALYRPAGAAGGPAASWITAGVYLAACAVVIGLGEQARTARRRAARTEAALREAESRLAAVLASIDDHLVCYDRQWRYTYVNEAATRVLGKPANELLGACIWELFPGAVGNLYHQKLHEAQETQHPLHFEFHYEPFDRWFANHVYPRPEGVTVFTADITDRKRAEQAAADAARALARERERLAVALRAGRMGVYEWTAGDVEVWWSPEIYPVYGVDPAHFRPTLEAFIALVHPDDRAELWRKTEESLALRAPFEHEYRIVHPDGRLRWVSNRSHVADDGGTLRLTGVAADVTERRDVEERLREADRRKDRFLAVLAHELRNPLAPIRNGLEVLLRAPGGAEAAAARAMIERQVRHMVRLIDDLLDVSRITNGKLVLKREPFNAADAIRAALETSRPLLEAGAHAVQVEFPAGPLPVLGDALRVAQVLANLLNNAARYTPAGGHVRVAAALEHDEVVITVSDNGRGIAPELLEHVFQPFTQVAEQPGTQGGLGLGLALARELVALHGGTLTAASDGPGRGSCFTVRLPATAAPPAPADASAVAPAVVAATKRRVLVVDDNADAAYSLGMLLQVMGQEVKVATDGDVALQQAPEFGPDLVLLDLGMPGRDGYAVAAGLRSHPLLARATLVALTGYGQEADRKRTGAAGFDLHLVKPVEAAALQALLAVPPPGSVPTHGGRDAESRS